MKTIVTAITQHPTAKLAMNTVLTEIATHGIWNLADQILDKAAERVAQHLVMQEQAQEKQGEINGI